MRLDLEMFGDSRISYAGIYFWILSLHWPITLNFPLFRTSFRNEAGSAFMIPYFLMVFIIGLPIFFAELVVGQFSGQGPIKAYTYIAPFFKGIGYCTLIVITLVTIYYQVNLNLNYWNYLTDFFFIVKVIISWIIFYLWSSFSSTLKWGSCSNSWNSESKTFFYYLKFIFFNEN